MLACGAVSQKNIEFRESEIHGRGCFAIQPIKKGTALIEYVGEKISKAESALRCEALNVYIFTLDDDFDVDGDMDWNPAKYINHSCAPNCEAEIFGDQIWIMSLRDIEVGEEISFNYSYDLEDHKDHPCRCGAPACVGYIVAEEFFPKLRQAAQKKKKSGKILAEKNLKE